MGKYINFTLLIVLAVLELRSQSTSLKPSDFQEVWHKDIPISGGLKFGTMYTVSLETKVQKIFFYKVA